MKRANKTMECGFSLLEALLSLTLGVLILGAAVNIFSRALNITFTVQQNAELQQDLRAVTNLMRQDIALAGAGLKLSSYPLASGTNAAPLYGCEAAGCHLGASNNQGVAFPGNLLYAIIPGPQKGITFDATKGASDIITVVYTDNVLQLSCGYSIAFPKADGTQVTFTKINPQPANCPQSPATSVQDLSDPVTGLQTGDFILFTNKVGGNAASAIGEVTPTTLNKTGPWTVNFANADANLLNQIAATSGDMAQITAGANTTAVRLNVITYYIDLCTTACGSTVGIPRLMRQVNGRAPNPVADNVTYMQFSYDTYDNSGNLLSNLRDAGAAQGVLPNQIRAINIIDLQIRSPRPDQSGLYHTLDVQASISARNLSFTNRYQ